jgi:TIR domain
MEIMQMLKSGKIEEVLTLLAKEKNSAKLVLADYRNEERLLKEGIVTESEFKAYEAFLRNRIANLPDEPDDLTNIENAEKASVFLSYSRADMDYALRIKEELSKYKIRIKMDIYDVAVGEPIKNFIVQQTKENNAVMILLSTNSLASAWVNYESTMAIFNLILNDARIILVSLDNGYLDDQFIFNVLQNIESEIEKKEQLIQLYQQKKMGVDHVEADKSRLKNAQNQLPSLLKSIRELAVYSIMGDEFKNNLKRIAEQLLEKQKIKP